MEIVYQSDIGRRRKTNQDYVGVFRNQAGAPLAILADGMGGHQAGDVASALAVNGLGEKWAQQTELVPEKVAQWLIKELQAQNEAIFDQGQATPSLAGMGTTFVGAAILEMNLVLANIGDSRAYLLRNEKLTQLTEDHSLVNELVKSGEISREMAANHPRKNVLTRSLGMPGTVEVDVTNHVLIDQDYLLLCSDGLTNMVSEEQIANLLQSEQSLAQKAQQLIDAANEAGGADNITVLIIQIKEQKEEGQ